MAKVSIDNYFDYFDLDVSFDIDIDALDSSYFELQSKNHPDCFFYAEPNKKTLVQNYIILINEAYKTLHSPLSRAEYLLSLRFKQCDVIKPTQEFLMEVMEIREEARNDISFLMNAYTSCVAKIKKAFVDYDAINMAHYTMRLRYITRIKEDLWN